MPTKIIFDEAKECPGDFSDRYLSTIRSAKYWHHVLNFGDNIPTNNKTIQHLQIERDKALKNESQRVKVAIAAKPFFALATNTIEG